jgi:hypothetical protein
MSDYRVEWVNLSGGKSVPAEKVICPECKVLDMNTGFDTSIEPAHAWCSQGHEWTFSTKADA